MLFCAFLVFKEAWHWLCSPQGAKPSIYLHTRQRNQSCLLHLPAATSTRGFCAPQPALRGANQPGPPCWIFESSQPGLGLLDGDQRGTWNPPGWVHTAQGGAPVWLPAPRASPAPLWVWMEAPSPPEEAGRGGGSCTPRQLKRRGANPCISQGCSCKQPAAGAALVPLVRAPGLSSHLR